MSGGPDARRILVVLSEQERELFFPGDLRQRLGALVPESRWKPPMETSAWRELLHAEDPEILLGAWSLPPIDGKLLAECPSLAFLCYVAGSLRSRIPRTYWQRGGVASNWGNVISNTVAECALTLALGCLREAPRYCHGMHVEKIYPSRDCPPPRSLFNRRVGIHGFGNIARALVKLLAPFEVSIEAWSVPVPPEVFAQTGVRQAASLLDLFANNDVVIDVEALTPESEGSVDESVIAALKPGAVFVNVGRGKVVDEAALAKRVVAGEISVGLDVYASEPLPADSPLRGLPNALLFPHTGGPTVDRYPACGRAALDNLDAFLAGRPLPQEFTLAMFDRAS